MFVFVSVVWNWCSTTTITKAIATTILVEFHQKGRVIYADPTSDSIKVERVFLGDPSSVRNWCFGAKMA